MINSIQQSNFTPRVSYARSNYHQAKTSFGQSSDEFVSQKPQEETFLQRNWGKLLVLGALAVGSAVAYKKGAFGKVKDDAAKAADDASKAASESKKAPAESAEEIAKREAAAKKVEEYKSNYKNGLKSQASGKVDEALGYFEKSIELNPDDPKAYLHRGFLREQKGDVDKALEDYKKVIELKPEHPDAYSNIANILIDRGDYENALGYINNAIERNPIDRDFYYIRANLHHKMGRTEDFITDLNMFERLGGKLD